MNLSNLAFYENTEVKQYCLVTLAMFAHYVHVNSNYHFNLQVHHVTN